MKLKKNWEIKAGFFTKVKNLYKKGGLNPAFYIYRYRFNNPNRDRIEEYPIDIIAELVNVCNLRCSMCFQSDKALPVSKTTKVNFMAMDTFRKIVDECAQNAIPALKLSWRGEPTLHKDFLEMIKYAKSKGILEVTTLTNGTLMSEDMCRGIVDARLDQLVVSIDGITKETYEKVRIGADYDKVLKNLNTLLAIRGRARKPFIRLQYTESDINRHETAQFYEYWNGKVDEISISYCKEFGSPQKEDANSTPIHSYCCPQLFQRLIIMTDGTVTVCATDVMGSIAIGNVCETSIKDLWHGPKLNKLRELHRSGKYHLNPMCRICVNHLFESNKKVGWVK